MYIPFGEVFVEQRDGNWNTPYLFNAKELDEETGLYYYGARYLDPTGVQWLSVDPLFDKYAGMSPYNYCHNKPVKHVDPNGTFVPNEDANLVAEIGDNLETLAEFQSITIEEARKQMERHKQRIRQNDPNAINEYNLLK